ncbi:MAG: 16S rRNA (guanine(527)-N(7))-methyltransferase RsmG [Flavobacteriales bacterium]|nr:16S rRNA (guanine(527)-N(7))-methyltransferase RsmG [Flavobacteriales bacterium]
MADVIFKYFPDLPSDHKDRLDLLHSLYEDWNSKINLISRKDLDHLYVRHVLHSLSIAKTFPFDDHTTVLDLGTGGGFPGIPLAILFPKVNFLLVDSIQKKIKVVNDVTLQLGLKNATAKCCRVESLNQTFDYITGRAVKSIPQIFEWTEKLINKESNARYSGIIYLTGGDIEKDLKNIKCKKKVIRISELFEEEYFETKKILRLYR